MMMNRTSWLHVGCLALAAVGCGATAGEPSPSDAVADLLYVGACSPADCDGQAVMEIGCVDGQPSYVCSAQNGGTCSVDVECPAADPDGTVGFAPCEDARCGATPAAPEAECPEGYAWSAVQCGSPNGSTCAWANHCAKIPAPVSAVDQSKLGPACDVDVQCTNPGEQCLTFPAGSGVDGARCAANPCELIGCAAGKCQVLETYPGQLRCAD